jgi:hypothetical protein
MMEPQRLALKLFAAAPCQATSAEYILFFHRMIQDGGLRETFVDVTDYSHVPDGPGVMLICHEAHYSMDRGGGRLGLRCATKRGATGDMAARVRWVLRKTLAACAAMESHEVLGGKIRFATDSLLFSIEDRLVAPSTDETFAAVAPVLSGVISSVWGTAPALTRAGSPKECFQIQATLPASPPLSDLVAHLDG